MSRSDRSSELRHSFGALLRSTLSQVGPVREVVEEQARKQKERFDASMRGRRRKQALAELGTLANERIKAGLWSADPVVQAAVETLDLLDSEEFENPSTLETQPARWDKSRKRHQGDSARNNTRDPFEEADLESYMHPDDVPGGR